MAHTILLVDDEATLREVVAQGLRDEGYRVIEAGDGSAALAAFRRDEPDLVLLDLMLPELSGIEVCRILRRESDVPILMLTARGSEMDKVVGLEVGADDYVTKPFSLRELVARVRALLRRSEVSDRRDGHAGAAGSTTSLGRVEVDLAGHRLLREGQPLPVKPKAFELLAFLLRHPGQAFTREQLLQHVWGYDYAGETRTVDVHVHWLRQVIEEEPHRPRLLETVRGVGYVLRPPAP
jgi:DNA-binding response OmpR family regulator